MLTEEQKLEIAILVEKKEKIEAISKLRLYLGWSPDIILANTLINDIYNEILLI